MDQDLIDLLSAWQGEELDAARCQQLLERLRRDDAFQHSFIAEIQMLGMIKVVQSTEPRWLRLQDELGWGGAGRPAELELEEALMRRVQGIPLHTGRRRWLGGLAAALLLAAATAGILAWTGHRAPNRPPAAGNVPIAAAPAPAPGSTPSPPPAVGSPSGLALLVMLEAAQWEPAQAGPPQHGAVLAPGRLQLRSGRAVLSFFSGVTLTLEGPADVDLIAIDRVFCRRGKLRARVPAGAEGFVIASPGSAVVDMGTEFALNVEADGKARVMVFEGAAEAALLDAAGAPTRTQVVEQSKSFDLDPHTGRIAEAVAQAERFVAAVDPAAAKLSIGSEYAAAVASARPVGYWRFETLDAGSVPNEVAGGRPLQIQGPITLADADESQTNRCAVFPAREPAQFLTAAGLWDLPAAPGHAVELWFLAEGISHASLAGFFPPKDYLSRGHHGRHVHTFLLELTAWDRRSLLKPSSIRFLHRWPLDTRIGSNIFSDQIYIPGRWHHLVAQKKGPQIELYFDGVLAHTLALQPDHPDVTGRLVLGRRTPDSLELEDHRTFVGRLDELAIYDHPLNPLEVRRHFELATITASPD
jgi:hypothetical protein